MKEILPLSKRYESMAKIMWLSQYNIKAELVLIAILCHVVRHR